MIRAASALILLSLVSGAIAAEPGWFAAHGFATRATLLEEVPAARAAHFVVADDAPADAEDGPWLEGPDGSGEQSAEDAEPEDDAAGFDLQYDDGVSLAVHDEGCRSFELTVNGRIQFRYAGFSRDVESYTDNAGVTIPVRNRSRFDIERARLILSGHAFSKKWKYFLQLDGDTDRASQVVFFDYWWAYDFDDRLEVRFGKAKVPGSRKWLLSGFKTRLVDRPMATGFFRPDRTQGVWAAGRLGPCCHYQAMVGNGYRTGGQTPQQVNDRFAAAGTCYWEPWGPLGPASTDFEQFDCPAVRLGGSFVYAEQSGVNDSGSPVAESAFARLSDGTVLTSRSALAPGVTVNAYDALLISLDAAAKYHGWSFDAEYYLRRLENLRGDGALPKHELHQHGFFVEGGCFLVPQTLDLNARYSQVHGDFGTSTEFACGLNLFPRRTPDVKLSFDATWLDGAPVSQTGSDFIVGDDGLLVRAQLQAFF